MPHRPALRTVIALLAAALVVGSIVAPGAFADTQAEALVESPSVDDAADETAVEQTTADEPSTDESSANESSTDESSTDEPSIEINCTEEEARITATDEYEYLITVASVDLSPSGTSSRSSSSGTYAGNETASIDGDGFTFVFVTNASTEETVAATYENCALAESEITTTEGTTTEGMTTEPTTMEQATTELTTTEQATTTEDVGPSIRIDCNESTVQVIAPEDYEYSLTVGSVTIAPGNLDSSSLGTSEAGNASMTFDGDLVYVFVEDGSSDEPVVSAVEYCGSVPADEPDANRTTQQTTANATTTESSLASQ